MKETWKTIEGFDAYEVSDFGRVRRKLPGRGGAVVGKVLKPKTSRKGYFSVNLYKDKKLFNKLIHRLVAVAFLPNPENLPQVNHTSDSTIDNRACKLEWISVEDHGRDRAKREQRGDGISFEKRRNKWKTYYSPESNKRKHIGYFNTYEEAKTARAIKIATL